MTSQERQELRAHIDAALRARLGVRAILRERIGKAFFGEIGAAVLQELDEAAA